VRCQLIARSIGSLLLGVVAGLWLCAARADTPSGGLEPIVAFVHEQLPEPPPLSLVEPVPADKGLAGARLAIKDNNTTGRFLRQSYQLKEVLVPAGGDVKGAVTKLLDAGVKLIVADLTKPRLLEVADMPGAKDAVILNAAAEDDDLRVSSCRANLFHVIPSRAMKADALAQYLASKNWRRLVLISGTGPGDIAYADAIRRAAKRFGEKIVEERTYAFQSGSRRTDTGEQQIRRQMVQLTQRLPDYDILVVADESQVFGDYLPYRTWDARPVAGTQGLMPTAWHRSNEQWGGTQLQHRFTALSGRWMFERDYTAWVAVRALGEAVTRTGKTDPATIRSYLLSDAFQLGAFKGVGLSFRRWDQQLRQPILLASPLMLVSVSPQEGFLHPRTTLDTLGYDEPESKCRLGS
jgi:ABC transporter substrate binding protein (PQQ-dependent alcohol dehydrogenase system)